MQIILQVEGRGVIWVQAIMSETPKEYQAYLVRIWQVKDKEGLNWRAYLTNASTSESRGFANLEELFEYLRQQTCQGSKPIEG